MGKNNGKTATQNDRFVIGYIIMYNFCVFCEKLNPAKFSRFPPCVFAGNKIGFFILKKKHSFVQKFKKRCL